MLLHMAGTVPPTRGVSVVARAPERSRRPRAPGRGRHRAPVARRTAPARTSARRPRASATTAVRCAGSAETAAQVLARRGVLDQRMTARRQRFGSRSTVGPERGRLRRAVRSTPTPDADGQREQREHRQRDGPRADQPSHTHADRRGRRHAPAASPAPGIALDRNRPIAAKTSPPMNRLARVRCGLRHAERRVVRHPPDARVEDLDPRVRVGLPHLEVAGQRVALAGAVARHEPRRDPERPQHDGASTLAICSQNPVRVSNRKWSTASTPSGSRGTSRSYSVFARIHDCDRRRLVVLGRRAGRDPRRQRAARAEGRSAGAAGTRVDPGRRRPVRRAQDPPASVTGTSETTEYTMPLVQQDRRADRAVPIHPQPARGEVDR